MRKFREICGLKQGKKKIIGRLFATILLASLMLSDGSMLVLAQGTQTEDSEEFTEEKTKGESTDTVDEEDSEEDSEKDLDKDSEKKDGEDVNSEDGDEASEDETSDEDAEEDEEEIEMMMAPVRGVRMMLGAAPAPEVMTIDANPGDTIDFSERLGATNTTTKKIEVNITANGSYTFKGENKRSDGFYADVQIKVDASANAEILFDGCTIINDDGEAGVNSSGLPDMFLHDAVTPLVVNGVAQISVSNDSLIEATYEYFNGNGTVRFENSVGDAKLTFRLSKYVNDFWGEACVTNNAMLMYFNDANVIISGNTSDGKHYGVSPMEFTGNPGFARPKFYFEKNKVQFDNVRISNSDIYYNDVSLPNVEFDLECKYFDLEGNAIVKYTVNSWTTDTVELLQAGRMKLTGVSIPSYRTIDFMWPESIDYVYAKHTSGDVKAYKVYYSEEEIQFRPVILRNCLIEDDEKKPAYLVTYKDNSGVTIDSFYVAGGEKLLFPTEDDDFDYKYVFGGTEIDKDTTASSNMEITVTKTEKGKINITIDEVAKEITYGKALSTIGVTADLIDASGKLYKPSDVIKEEKTFTTLRLTKRTEAGKEWYELNNKDDMTTFAKMVNAGSNDINGYLNSNITLDNSFPMIGCDENCFVGSFNGNSHCVTINKETQNETAGLFAYISSGAVIQNVNVSGTVKAKNYPGGLVGTIKAKTGSDIIIEKCINSANVISTPAYAEVDFAAGIVANITSGVGMRVTIENCGNTGRIQSGSNNANEWFQLGIFGRRESSSVTVAVKNCFNSDDSFITRDCTSCDNSYSRKVDTSKSYGIQKDAEAFSSGEVTYLLNKGSENPVWRQTCGAGAPSFTGSVVYAGYANCEDTTLSYANTVFTHTTPGHENKSEYSYNDGKIVGKCKFCTKEIIAEIVAPTEKLGAQKGVTAKYSSDWQNANFPNISFKYSSEIDGEYTDAIPSTVGTWYIKAFVGSSETGIVIDDITYTTLPAPVHNKDASSGESASQGIPNWDEKFVEYVKETVSLINAINKDKEIDNTKDNNTKRTVEYSANSIPRSIMNALANSNGVTIHYSTVYMGKKYDFVITKEIAMMADKSVPYYGPMYIQHLINISKVGFDYNGNVYTVKAGDNLYGISKRLGITMARLLQLNPGYNNIKSLIFPGQKVYY